MADLMEGISYEAMSMAGAYETWQINCVILIQMRFLLDGESQAFLFAEDMQKRAESIHWQYLRVEDGNDVDANYKSNRTWQNKYGHNQLLLKLERLLVMEVQKLRERTKHMVIRLESGRSQSNKNKCMAGIMKKTYLCAGRSKRLILMKLKQKGIDKENRMESVV